MVELGGSSPPDWAVFADLHFLSEKLGCRVVSATYSNERALDQSKIVFVSCILDNSLVRSLILKVSNPITMIHRSEEKVRISQRSFRNELSFYSVVSPELRDSLLQIGRVVIPKILFATSKKGDQHPLYDEDFICLMETLDITHAKDLSNTSEGPKGMGLIEYYTYNRKNILQALSCLANFHAFFWEDDNLKSESSILKQLDELRLFKPGGWWRCPWRPSVNFYDIPKVFQTLYENIPQFKDAGILPMGEQLALMERLAQSHLKIADYTARGPHHTIVHGDAKSSNVFLLQTLLQHPSTLNIELSSAPFGALIDFQWSGPGRTGLGDVVYILSSCTDYALIANDESLTQLLDHYYEEFCKSLCAKFAMFGIPDVEQKMPFSKAELIREFQIEFLDYATTVIPYLIPDLTSELAKKNQGRYGWLTFEYDLRHTTWFVAKTLEYSKLHLDFFEKL